MRPFYEILLLKVYIFLRCFFPAPLPPSLPRISRLKVLLTRAVYDNGFCSRLNSCSLARKFVVRVKATDVDFLS